MRIVSIFLLLVIAFGTIAFSAFRLNRVVSPCDKSIGYRIDTVDPKFRISREEFLAAAEQASSLWNGVASRKLLVYDPQGSLSVNLIFDERQSLIFAIDELSSTIEKSKESIESKVQIYERDVADFKKRLNKLNGEIQYWNSLGGAPASEYERLIQEQRNLEQEAKKLNERAQKLGRSTENYNAQVGKLNKTVTSFNQALHERPEGGIFKGEENKIEIYLSNGKDDLVRILAHEMGHALGIAHVSNPDSIMYPVDNKQSSLSYEDVSALENVCRGQKIFEILKIKLSDFIREKSAGFSGAIQLVN